MKNVLLMGAGPMAMAYAQVLEKMGVAYDVVGRGAASAALFEEKYHKKVIRDDSWKHQTYSHAIVAVSMEQLTTVTLNVLETTINTVLVEKPAGLNGAELTRLAHEAAAANAKVWVGYNRRFYAAVLEAEKRIEADGGLRSVHFEFTEWSHVIEPLQKAPGVKENWFLGNSTHVVDLAFFFMGEPASLQAYKSGSINWHPAGAAFVGAGKSINDVLFSYHANWQAPGRWSVELLTAKNRYYLKPMEKLHVQTLGSVAVNEIPLNDELDINFKPGIYLQTAAYLNGTTDRFVSIETQARLANGAYQQMLNG